MKIFEELAKDSKRTISDLVNATGYHPVTIRGYLELIEYIQKQDHLNLERTGHSYLASLQKRESSLSNEPAEHEK
jgi:DeoR/GlpR family transcriptional regulator of sugar metabolism